MATKFKLISLKDLSFWINGFRFNSPVIIGSHDLLVHPGSLAVPWEHLSLGAIVSKSFTINPREGGKDPICVPIADGLLVASGLRNPGMRIMLENINLFQRNHPNLPIIASLAVDPSKPWINPGEELAYLAKACIRQGIPMLALNLTCPNTGEAETLADRPDQVRQIVGTVRNALDQVSSHFLLIAKLRGGPMLPAIVQGCDQAGAHAVSFSNIPQAMGFYTGILPSSKDKQLGESLVGGLQGAATGSILGPVNLRSIYEVFPHTRMPIIATSGALGGLKSTPDEKLDMMIQTFMAGAQAVETVTPFYPLTSPEHQSNLINLVEGLKEYTSRQNMPFNTLVGKAHDANRIVVVQPRVTPSIQHVLIVGYGKAGKLHVEKWKGLGCIVSICESDFEKRRLAEQDGLNAFDDIQAAISTSAPQLIDIATPTKTHIPLLIKILSNNPNNLRGIMVEKPVTNELSDLLYLKNLPSNIRKKILVNENYLYSAVLKQVQQLIQEYQLSQYDLYLEFSKDRTSDEASGRFMDANLGAFGIELSHPIACVMALGEEKKPETILFTNYSQNNSYDEARLIYLAKDGTKVHIFSSLRGLNGGEFGNRHYEQTPRRELILKDASGVGIHAQFEPIHGYPRLEGRITVKQGANILKTIAPIHDDSLMETLSASKQYFEGQIGVHNSTLTIADEVAQLLLRVTKYSELLEAHSSWNYLAQQKFRSTLSLSSALLNHHYRQPLISETQTDYFPGSNSSLSDKIIFYRERISEQGVTYEAVAKVRATQNILSDSLSRYESRKPIAESDFLIKTKEITHSLSKKRTTLDIEGMIVHIDEITHVNGETLNPSEHFLEIQTSPDLFKTKAVDFLRKLGMAFTPIPRSYHDLFIRTGEAN